MIIYDSFKKKNKKYKGFCGFFFKRVICEEKIKDINLWITIGWQYIVNLLMPYVYPVEVKESTIAGKGLFAVDDIPKGAIYWVY